MILIGNQNRFDSLAIGMMKMVLKRFSQRLGMRVIVNMGARVTYGGGQD